MAIIKPGVIGDFSGKIGRVVVSSWRDLIVGRSVPKASTKAPSAEQVDQRAVFLLVVKFLKSIKKTINIGYLYTGKMSGMNVAVQYHLLNAITGIAPNRTIDFTKVVISNGLLNSVYDPSVVGATGNSMNVTWTDDAVVGDGTTPEDGVYLLFYNPTLLSSVTSTAVAQRSTLTANVKMPRLFIGGSVHAWMFLLAADGLSVSKSEYLGLKPVIA